jgi:hypothetical protein
MRLGVDIDEPDALAGAREGGAEIHGGGCFTDAALLIDDGNAAHEKLFAISL